MLDGQQAFSTEIKEAPFPHYLHCVFDYSYILDDLTQWISVKNASFTCAQFSTLYPPTTIFLYDKDNVSIQAFLAIKLGMEIHNVSSQEPLKSIFNLSVQYSGTLGIDHSKATTEVYLVPTFLGRHLCCSYELLSLEKNLIYYFKSDEPCK